MQSWFWYSVGAAVLYALHQVFTKLAAPHISDGLGGLIVEATAAVSIGVYLVALAYSGRWDQTAAGAGIAYSAVTGICVSAGTVLFFLMFQAGGPLTAVPAILAVGAALMALAGMAFFGETPSAQRLAGVALSVAALYLLRSA